MCKTWERELACEGTYSKCFSLFHCIHKDFVPKHKKRQEKMKYTHGKSKYEHGKFLPWLLNECLQRHSEQAKQGNGGLGQDSSKV